MERIQSDLLRQYIRLFLGELGPYEGMVANGPASFLQHLRTLQILKGFPELLHLGIILLIILKGEIAIIRQALIPLLDTLLISRVGCLLVVDDGQQKRIAALFSVIEHLDKVRHTSLTTWLTRLSNLD